MRERAEPSDPRVGGLAHALWTLAKPGRFPARRPTHTGVRYVAERRAGVQPLCDVYLPEGPGPHPSVLLVHGGGFVIGHRRMKPVRLLASRLVDAGHAVCSIDYRLVLRGGGLDDQLADVDAAAAFWRERAPGWDCDPERISLAGFSAGATLMLLHAGRSGWPYHRLISIYGATELDRMRGRRVSVLLRLALGTGDRSHWRLRSPVHTSQHPAPLLLIHGTADRLVPVGHAERLHALRRAQGLESELVLVDGMPHGWLNDAHLPETDDAIDHVIRFLDT